MYISLDIFSDVSGKVIIGNYMQQGGSKEQCNINSYSLRNKLNSVRFSLH